jgi:anti-sigma factor RsiW
MMNMSHEDVVSGGLVERYLLRELPEPLAGEFEEHYFGCSSCADDVRHGQALIDEIKKL